LKSGPARCVELWIESADGLIQLKDEADAAIAGTSVSPP